MEELVIHGTYFTSKNINEVESHEDHIICIEHERYHQLMMSILKY